MHSATETATSRPGPGDLGLEQHDAHPQDTWQRDGFIRIDGFADPAVGDAMRERVIALARAAAAGEDIEPAFVMPEQQADGFADARGEAPDPEDLVSKVFRLHRDAAFADFVADDRLLDLVAALLGSDDVDCFLSQFIFKNPGAWGQPWHQDSYYFPFEPAHAGATARAVGAWLAVSEATPENGCLHVVPGSHALPIQHHGPDPREGANYGYVEIPDVDESRSVPVLMEPGDLLLFDSHLMHRSTDNRADTPRAAMVFHFAVAGTVDRTLETQGYTINDWVAVRRAPDGAS